MKCNCFGEITPAKSWNFEIHLEVEFFGHFSKGVERLKQIDIFNFN